MSAEQDQAFLDKMEAVDSYPLWLAHANRTPGPKVEPHVWRWETMKELAYEAGALESLKGAGVRRALLLRNPGLKASGATGSTKTISAAVQIVWPGEIAEALELCARGEVWPLVTETWKLEEANAVHERLEAEAITGRAAIVIGMAIGSADHEAAFAHAVVTPAFKNGCEFLGPEVLATLVQQHGLERRLRIGNASAGFGQLGKLQGPLDALGIALDQIFFGGTGNFPASDDV